MNPRVETSCGRLEGIEEGGIRVFRGIPFARPPLGILRFRAPQAPEPWAGVRDASASGRAALQAASMFAPLLGLDVDALSEDCLYLNVWTPGVDSARRPVLVWIHGGGFVIGSGNLQPFDGSLLARRGDAVVVTINYRLGALGLLHLEQSGPLQASGNNGLLDQVAALQWVRDEIVNFGGDANNVTVFGESAGSISIATLLGMPSAAGLFQKAILQSGAANFVSTRERAAQVADSFLRELGVSGGEVAKLVDMPGDRILEAQRRVSMATRRGEGMPFQPVIDGETLPQDPLAAIAAGSAREVALLIGTNLDEMKLFGLVDQEARTLDDVKLAARCERIMPGSDGNASEQARRAIEAYRQARAARAVSCVPAEIWFAIESDRNFRHPAMHLAELQSAQQPHTYAYLFTWPSPFMDGILGACHALEIPFVFGTRNTPQMLSITGTGAAADALSERIQDAWLAFARNGAPSHAGVGDWPAYEPQRRATLILDAECELASAPLEEERRFWESLA